MTNPIIDGFLKFNRPGYNLPEQTWHYKRFQSQQAKIAGLADLAKKIADESEMTVAAATEVLIRAEQQDTEALATLGPWLLDFSEISEGIAEQKNTQERDLATMMLVSRLPLVWVLDNQETLEAEYCIELPANKADLDPKSQDPTAINYERLATLKRSKWLDSKDLWSVMRAITNMLPGSVIGEISDYALNEFRDGKTLETAKPERPHEQLGKPESESKPPEKASDG